MSVDKQSVSRDLEAKLDEGELEIYRNLTDMQKEDYRQIFDLFDSDGGGAIENEEITQVFESLGQKCTDEEV